jgi:hypothetical protein
LKRIGIITLSVVVAAAAAFSAPCINAQERPYFVTYSHALEEPGSLEVAVKTVAGAPAGSGEFGSATLELEYGVTAWWTTEMYLSGQKTASDSTIFTGFRLENRARPFLGEHWINPVLYFEFEDINGADKSLLEVVGHDGTTNFAGTNAANGSEKKREVEFKLLLSRNWQGWNFAQNTIFEKNLINQPWEFGYATAASRPLRLSATGRSCSLCAERLSAGVEMYGGLGDRYTPGLHDTSHYVSPTIEWETRHGTTFLIGPAIGLTANSARILARMKVSFELPQVFQRGGR